MTRQVVGATSRAPRSVALDHHRAAERQEPGPGDPKVSPRPVVTLLEPRQDQESRHGANSAESERGQAMRKGAGQHVERRKETERRTRRRKENCANQRAEVRRASPGRKTLHPRLPNPHPNVSRLAQEKAHVCEAKGAKIVADLEVRGREGSPA